MCHAATQEFGCSVEEVPRARRSVLSRLTEWRIPPSDPAGLVRDEVELVTSELASNAVRFCRTGFSVALTAHRDHFLVVVGDDGPPTQALTTGVESGPLEASADAESGRGLFIVDAIASSWSVEVSGTPGGLDRTRVWARIDFQRPSPHLLVDCRLAPS